MRERVCRQNLGLSAPPAADRFGRTASAFATRSNQGLDRLDQLRDVDRVGEGQVLDVPRHAGQDLVGLALEQDDVFKPQHGAQMRGPRVVLAFGDDLDDLCSGRARSTYSTGRRTHRR